MEHSGAKLKSFISSLLFFFSIFVIIDVSVDMVGNVSGDIIYVNTTGDGGAYTSIQDAINASNDGDTVFVYSGTYYENVAVNKTINLTGINSDNTTIDGGGGGDVLYISVDWVNITGFRIINSSNDAGIKLDNVQNCRVFNNNISNNGYGIYLFNSLRNLLLNNYVNLNYFIGIHLIAGSNDNSLINNNISNTIGIRIDKSLYNKLYDNKINDCGIFLYGSQDTFTTQEIPFNNTVNDKPIYYYKNSDMANTSVPLNAGQVILGNVSWAKVENLNISNGGVGIEMGYSSNNYIANNTFLSNYYGIYLYYNCDNNMIMNNTIIRSDEIAFLVTKSNKNKILGNNCSYNYKTGFSFGISNENTIKNNVCTNNIGAGFNIQFFDDNVIENNIISNNNVGIYLWFTTNNRIFYNSFIDNNRSIDSGGNNLWNNTYPLGGNYWSNYTGVDEYKGPNQDIPGKDGIGDTPYPYIESSPKIFDNYPLMSPYKPLMNYTVLMQGWNLISIPLIQEEQNLTNVLGSVNNWYDAVQWYDNSDQNNPWKHNKIGKPFGNDLYELNESMGFWIHITQPGDTIFLYNGTQPTSNHSITLHPGWNMVGYPSLTSYNRTEGLNNLTFDNHVDAIWSYDAFTQKWKEMGESDYFIIGRGYYIHSNSECEWEVPL